MTGIWTPETRYFIKLNNGQLKQVLASVILEKFKYKPKEDGSEWILEEVCRCYKKLPANKIAIDIQISSYGFTNEKAVLDFITESDFEFAKQDQYGVDQFLTREEYDELIPIE